MTEEISLLETNNGVDRSETDGKYLTFFTENQLFGVPIADVVQIVGVQEITKIPEFPDYAKGVINLRGNIIPLIDIRLRFHKEEVPYDEHTCIIVTSIKGNEIGFIVDSVDAVTDIADDQISAPPKLSSDTVNTYITGVARLENSVVLLLDTARILSDEAISEITSSI